jgi:hypothetical protein
MVPQVNLAAMPLRVLVYARSGGLRAMSDEQAEEVITRVVDALKFLGNEVELMRPGNTWTDSP